MSKKIIRGIFIVSIAGAILLLAYTFGNYSSPRMYPAADVNRDGSVDLQDVSIVMSEMDTTTTISAPETAGSTATTTE